MLTPDALNDALTIALKAAHPACSHVCRTGIERDEDTVRIYHNGRSSGDTDAQVIHNPAVLSLSKELLAAKLGTWLGACHKRERLDLNGTT